MISVVLKKEERVLDWINRMDTKEDNNALLVIYRLNINSNKKQHCFSLTVIA